MPCILREYKTGLVCVCNATYCDTLELEAPSAEGEVVLISTSKNGLRFKDAGARFNDERTILTDLQFTKREFTRGERQNFWLFNVFNKPVDVVVNRDKKFQTIVGFGNAFTGTVSHLLKHAPDLNENIFRSYFSKDVGNGFNMIRMPIGGSDFDLEPWAYNELPVNDVALSNFTKFDKRDVERNAQIKNLRTVSGNWDIKFVGAAWSSPKWMKTNGEWTGFSALKDEYFQTWADYHVKFLEMMKNDGIDFWAISTGNEPLNGVSAYLFIKFMSLGWLPNTQGKWVAENLGPSLNKSQSVSHVKILAGDDQRYTVPYWFDQMYATYPKSEKFVSGHAVHWYWDKYVSADRLDLSHQKYPEKLIIATEACSGDKPWEEHRPLLGDWSRCEDYIVDIIQDLNHYANAWIDWNMILDPNGGPNYVSNFVDSPMVINTTSKQTGHCPMVQISDRLLFLKVTMSFISNRLSTPWVTSPDSFYPIL